MNLLTLAVHYITTLYIHDCIYCFLYMLYSPHVPYIMVYTYVKCYRQGVCKYGLIRTQNSELRILFNIIHEDCNKLVIVTILKITVIKGKKI